MSPEEAKIVARFLIDEFAYETQTTMSVIQAAPKDGLAYRPDPKSKTGLELIRHITLEDEWILNCIADGVFTTPPDGSDACGIMTPAEAVSRYKAKIPLALDRLRALSGDQLTKVIDLLGMIQLPTVNFISLAGKHSVHHRGQLSTYLRAMGGKIPGIYGPTADTQ